MHDMKKNKTQEEYSEIRWKYMQFGQADIWAQS